MRGGAPVARREVATTAAALPHRAVSRTVILAALVGLFVIWSNSYHAIAYLRRDLNISAMNLVTLRYGPVLPFALAYCLARRRALRALFARDGWAVGLMGIMTIPGYNLALNWGQARVPPVTASLIVAMNPVFTLVLALAFLSERARALKIAGMAVAFLGVFLLIRTQQHALGDGYLPYALVVLLAPLAWAIATVVGKPITARADPLLLTFAAMALGSLPFGIALATGAGGVHAILGTLPATGWIALAHLTILCTLVGFAIWFWALRHLPASTVAAFVFLNPPFAELFGFIWGTEAFHWSTVGFGAITLLGVAMSADVLRLRRGGR
jgi:drug/metabolite transporter (DMT)-like permease